MSTETASEQTLHEQVAELREAVSALLTIASFQRANMDEADEDDRRPAEEMRDLGKRWIAAFRTIRAHRLNKGRS